MAATLCSVLPLTRDPGSSDSSALIFHALLYRTGRHDVFGAAFDRCAVFEVLLALEDGDADGFATAPRDVDTLVILDGAEGVLLEEEDAASPEDLVVLDDAEGPPLEEEGVLRPDIVGVADGAVGAVDRWNQKQRRDAGSCVFVHFSASISSTFFRLLCQEDIRRNLSDMAAH